MIDFLELEKDKAVMECIKENIYDLIISMLPIHPEESRHRMWVNEGTGEIMCATLDEANTLANFFEELGYDIMHTFCYDDEETDGLNYGWCAVYVDGM